jgi:PAB-dependent poly(A)-specific ribonuclease subunit 2
MELDLWRAYPSPDEAFLPAQIRIRIDTATRVPRVERVDPARARLFADDGEAKGEAARSASNASGVSNASRSSSGGSSVEAVYELVAVISHITDPPDKDSPLHVINGEHLCAHVRVQEIYGQARDSPDRWYIFNDFVVHPSSLSEAVRFDYPWKQPCVLRYARVDLDARVAIAPLSNPITPNLLEHAESIFPRLSRRNVAALQRSFRPLSSYEELKPGDIVAVDSEFVCVEVEESVVRPDGSKLVLKPSRLTLGRVSVLRGEGPRMGEAFIDDYIATSEPVVDYLTQYSGLKPGDLDPQISRHNLVTLKEAYVRLRALVDRGIRFVGHGLRNDFQMMNIVVPPEQVLDTVDLFYAEGARRLGLKFLAVQLLGMEIQRDVHDSIEDARTALMLYNRYVELKREGRVEKAIADLYRIGEIQGFKVE